MIVCIDYDRTITSDPSFFRGVMAGLRQAGHQVHVLSADEFGPPTPKRMEEVRRGLHQLGLGGCYDAINLVAGPHKKIPRNKVAYMRKVGASHLIDNRKGNCKAAAKAGFTAYHRLAPRA